MRAPVPFSWIGDEQKQRNMKIRFFVIITFLIGSGCAEEPEPIVEGLDECARCRMLISDSRFAAQLVTEEGKHLKLDSIECMLDVMREDTKYPFVWVSNAAKPGEWLEAEQAVFVRSDQIRSPMGGGLAAFESEVDAKSVTGGTLLTWRELTARL